MILDKVRRTIKRFGLVERGDRVLVAVSGGPDSVCLLDVLVKLSKEMGCSLGVVHFNHRLRREAEEEERFVKELADRYDLPFFCGSSDVAKVVRERGLGVEEAARAERYNFFEQVLRKKGYDKVALGHTLSDNVETFFMRVLRGASLEGLKGIPPKRGIYVRPLIEVKRKEVREYLRNLGLDWVEDTSNQDERFLRNWVRMRLVPLLRERNPSIEDTMAFLLDGLRWDWDLVEGLVEKALSELDYRFENESLYINLENFTFHEALKRHVLFRLLYQYFYPGMSGVLTTAHVEGILGLLEDKRGSKGVDLPQGIEAVREYNMLRIGLKREDPTDSELLLMGEGVYTFGDYVFTVKVGDFSKVIAAGRWCALFDPDRVKFPLVLRYRRPGDRLFIPGVGRKKLQDFFVDRKVPRAERERIPLLLSKDGEVLWIVGYRQREDLRPSSGKAIFIEARRRR